MSDPLGVDRAFSLDGQIALITGGAAGIGRAIATAFAERGATVVLADRDPTVTETAAALPGRNHLGVVVDVTEEGAPKRVVDDVVGRFGKIDILVNNAGIVILAKAEEVRRADWDKTIAVNVTAPFLFAQAAGPHMMARGFGRIVNLASQAAVVALPQHLAYCTSKAAILGITQVLALEWGPHGITVNAISPTVVETELGRKAWAGEVGDAMKKLIPSRRFAQPEEIALAALYLASPAAGMVNGANLAIDGGYTIQ